MGFLKELEEKWKEKKFRVRCCFYALEVGTVVCSAIDKILTFLALTYWGCVELNPIAATLMKLIGVGPAVIAGFILSIMPMLAFHYGIRRFKWDTEGHYWLYTFFMIFYFTIFYKLIEKEILRLL